MSKKLQSDEIKKKSNFQNFEKKCARIAVPILKVLDFLKSVSIDTWDTFFVRKEGAGTLLYDILIGVFFLLKWSSL